MMNAKKIWAVTLAAGISIGNAAAEEQASYRIYVIRPTINNRGILADEPLPEQCRKETVMKMMCARGEYEPTSFLVETEKPLKQVMVNVGPLKGKAGTLPPGSVDVRVALMTYLHVGVDGIIMPWILVRDPNMLKIVDQHPQWVLEMKDEMVGPPNARRPLAEYRKGYSKMMQLTREMVDTPDLQPSDVSGRQQFWLTVRVPDDAKAGTYRGEVTITAANSKSTTLTLEVTVPSFELLPPPFEYSVYYPTQLQRPGLSDAQREKYNPVSEDQYVAELRNMLAHGCSNPNIYQGPMRKEDGTLDYSTLETILKLREKAGLPKGTPLYMMTHAGEPQQRPLTEEERERAVRETRELVAWVRARGYTDAYIMAGDELSGEKLASQRDSIEALRKGGGKVWAACYNDFFKLVGDIFDLPIFCFPGSLIVDSQQQWQVSSRDQILKQNELTTYSPRLMLTPEIQKIIEGVHHNGFKIFTYMDPPAGYQLPDWHRRLRGLGLWKIGLDGTMTWAYFHTWMRVQRPDDPHVKANGVSVGNGFVVRGPNGVLDTLNWEAYREGYDDARYLATLRGAMDKAKAAGKHAKLVADTQRWLDKIDVDADLDQWRSEMARRTESLMEKP